MDRTTRKCGTALCDITLPKSLGVCVTKEAKLGLEYKAFSLFIILFAGKVGKVIHKAPLSTVHP